MNPAATQPSDHRTRLVFLIRDLGFAGAQRQLVTLATGLDPVRFDITVVSFYPGAQVEELEQQGVKVIVIGKRHRWDILGFFVRLVGTLRKLRPQILHSYLNESNLLGALLKPLLPGVKLVWGLRDSQTDAALFGWLGKLVFHLTTWLSRVPDLFIANSHSGAAYYARLGYPAHKIRVIANGIDHIRFQPDASQRGQLRAEWGIPENAFLFGLIGRISPMKDMLTGIAAVKLLPQHVHLIIIGAGDADYAQQLRSRADDRIHFAAPRPDMPAVYSALDAVVSSSAFGEGFSNVLGEAMACGLPCAATDVGDSARLLSTPTLIASPGDPAELASAMQRVLENPDSIGASNQARLLEHFTIPRMVEATAEALTAEPPQKLMFCITGLGSGGAEMMLTNLCGQLDRRKFSPVVVSLIDGGKHIAKLEDMGIAVQTLGMKPGKPSLSALWRLWQCARRERPDLYVGWMYHGNLAATLASWFAHRAPVVWNVRQTLYNLALEKRGSALVIKALAWLSWQPRHIIYNSRLSAQQHEAIGYRKERTRITCNGFNTETFRPDPIAGQRLREELCLAPETLLVGRLGRNAAMKDYPTLIEAAKRVTATHPHIHFVIAGTDTHHLPAQANVHLLGERSDIAALTAALDLACSSSAFGEGFPNVLAEAMCCEVPVVTTDVGDSAALVADAGLIVPSGDPQALSEAIIKAISSPLAERQALGAKGRERILRDFSLAAVTRGYEQLLLPTIHNLKSKIQCVA
jgi:glycosyltransferase involved in cell wall biosynthesis